MECLQDQEERNDDQNEWKDLAHEYPAHRQPSEHGRMTREPIRGRQRHEHREQRATERELQAVRRAAHEVLLAERREVVVDGRVNRDERWDESDELARTLERRREHPEKREREEEHQREERRVLQRRRGG